MNITALVVIFIAQTHVLVSNTHTHTHTQAHAHPFSVFFKEYTSLVFTHLSFTWMIRSLPTLEALFRVMESEV